MTFFDSQGQPVVGQGVDAIKKVDFARKIVGGPCDHGFDTFYGTACCPTTDWLYAYIENDRVPVPPQRLIDKSQLPKHPYANDCREGWVAENFLMDQVDMVFLEKSRQFIETHVSESHDKPFFLFHSTQAVHLPSFAAPQFQGKSGAGPHGDFIHELDHIVGELMSTLERLKIADNTIVIFTSDNGPETTSVIHMRKDFGHDGARPWRGVKRDNWEGGHRVPFIARWPAKIAPGTSCDQPVCLTDVMATVAEIVGAELPENAAEDSFSLLQPMLGKANSPIRPYLLHQAFSGQKTLAIRSGPWKYIDHVGSGGNNYDNNPGLKPFAISDTAPTAPAQLYNLDTDPGETRNLYFEQPKVVEQLKSLLSQSKLSGRSRVGIQANAK